MAFEFRGLMVVFREFCCKEEIREALFQSCTDEGLVKPSTDA